jgi:hypothetical protein
MNLAIQGDWASGCAAGNAVSGAEVVWTHGREPLFSLPPIVPRGGGT